MLPLSKIKDARKGGNKSKTAIAEACGCHVDRITRLEAGQSIALLQDYCNALDCDIYILTRAESGILQGIKAVIEQNSPKMAKNKGECGE